MAQRALRPQAAAVWLCAGGRISQQVEEDVQELVQQALSVAKSVIEANRDLHGSMSRKLESSERLDGHALQDWLASVTVPDDLRDFVHKGQDRKPSKQQLAGR